MEYTISNHYLSATIDSLGAQLTSLKKTEEAQEYIWKADPEIWVRHAPILFPIVGRLKGDKYRYEGKEYSLGQHGFARNLEFEILLKDSDKLIFVLKESEETLENYPFPFTLRVTYTLWKNILYNTYEVSTEGSQEIYFSIGGHPGFTCPIDPGSQRSDYYLEFEKEETVSSQILTGGTISNETKPIIVHKKIDLIDNLFDEDALIFKNLNSEKLGLKHKSGKAVLHFHFPEFPYLGIWSINQTSPYVCIEPWFGLADSYDHDGDLTKKEGIQKLSPGDVFRCEYGIEID